MKRRALELWDQTYPFALQPRFSSCVVLQMRIRVSHCVSRQVTPRECQLCRQYPRRARGKCHANERVHKHSNEGRKNVNTLFVSKVQTSILLSLSGFSGWGCQCTVIVTFSGPPLFSRSPPWLTRALASRAIEARSSSSTILSIESSIYSFDGESGRGTFPNSLLQKLLGRPNLVNIHGKLTE